MVETLNSGPKVSRGAERLSHLADFVFAIPTVVPVGETVQRIARIAYPNLPGSERGDHVLTLARSNQSPGSAERGKAHGCGPVLTGRAILGDGGLAREQAAEYGLQLQASSGEGA